MEQKGKKKKIDYLSIFIVLRDASYVCGAYSTMISSCYSGFLHNCLKKSMQLASISAHLEATGTIKKKNRS
jgi:hypothetical protein